MLSWKFHYCLLTDKIQHYRILFSCVWTQMWIMGQRRVMSSECECPKLFFLLVLPVNVKHAHQVSIDEVYVTRINICLVVNKEITVCVFPRILTFEKKCLDSRSVWTPWPSLSILYCILYVFLFPFSCVKITVCDCASVWNQTVASTLCGRAFLEEEKANS